METPSIFTSCSLFASLTQEQLQRLASSSVITSCPKGKLLFDEGQKADGLYIMAEGQVKIFRSTPDGREAVLHVFGAGEPFGEVAVFQGSTFPASAVCIASGSVVFLPRQMLLEQIERDPILALNMLASLSRRLRWFAAKVETLTLMETPQRLAAYLLLTSEENEGASTIHLDVSKALLAGILGTARETLSRCLTRMVDQEVISVEGRAVHILDREFLEALVQGTENL